MISQMDLLCAHYGFALCQVLIICNGNYGVNQAFMELSDMWYLKFKWLTVELSIIFSVHKVNKLLGQYPNNTEV